MADNNPQESPQGNPQGNPANNGANAPPRVIKWYWYGWNAETGRLEPIRRVVHEF